MYKLKCFFLLRFAFVGRVIIKQKKKKNKARKKQERKFLKNNLRREKKLLIYELVDTTNEYRVSR